VLQVITTSHSVSVMATATRMRIRYHCIVCSSECEKRSICCVDCGRWTHIDCVGSCERVLDVRGIDDQKIFHLLGECGFGITLWSLCGRFSLWPFWMYPVVACGLRGLEFDMPCLPVAQCGVTA